jgi:UDP-galactopyranose mutase
MTTAPQVDVLVVGAGFAGAVMAERLAEAERSVLVIDRRDHLGGNAHDRLDAHGVLIHPYGPHIFHTNSDEVFAYLSRFTAWRAYEHRVLARVPWRGGHPLVPIPINRATVNRLYGLDLDAAGVAAFLERQREPRQPRATAEDAVLDQVGRELCDAFFRGYTRKQWGRDLAALDAAVTARIPVRHDDDDRYFTDRHQAMPADGFDALFRRLLTHPRIRVELGRPFDPAHDRARARHLVYTGPIDHFYADHFGPLPWRSLRFELHHQPQGGLALPAAVVNECDAAVPYTRTSEMRRITGQEHAGTTLVREYAQAEGDPYYPIPAPEARALHHRYHELAEREHGVTFVGRLAQYRYFNMDQVVGAALAKARELTGAST